VRSEGDAYLPARPPASIAVADVLRAAQAGCAGEDAIERSPAATALRAAQLARAGDCSLAPGAPAGGATLP
jgi:hypothetical protein